MSDKEVMQMALTLVDVLETDKIITEREAETLRAALARPEPEPEPVAWVDLQKEAQKIVESKFLWKRFIDGTPLSNDIACWMADFAEQCTSPPQRPWQRLTDEEIWNADEIMAANSECGASFETLRQLVHAIEAKLKEKNT